jgi:hypothetical protein
MGDHSHVLGEVAEEIEREWQRLDRKYGRERPAPSL